MLIHLRLAKSLQFLICCAVNAIRLLALFVVSLGLSACAVTEGSLEDVGTQLEQGIQGQGRIVPNDPTSDSFGSEYQ